MEVKEIGAQGHQSNIELRSKKVGSYLTVFNLKQLHWEVFHNNSFFFWFAEYWAVSKKFGSLNVATLFCCLFHSGDMMWCDVSMCVRSKRQSVWVLCSRILGWGAMEHIFRWSGNSVSFPALSMAVVGGKQLIQNSWVGRAIFSASFASGPWIQLYFICSQMFAAKGLHFRAEISHTTNLTSLYYPLKKKVQNLLIFTTRMAFCFLSCQCCDPSFINDPSQVIKSRHYPVVNKIINSSVEERSITKRWFSENICENF